MLTMDIIFGIHADPGAFPSHGGGSTGGLGVPVVGPQGLLDILETALGLGSPRASQVVRLASIQAKLQRLEGAPPFWASSFAVDPWATSRTILRWRDELVDAGWSGSGVWNALRLADLARLEQTPGRVPPGIADRLSQLCVRLADGPQLPVGRIRLIDPRPELPPGWGRLIDAIAASGVIVEELATTPAAPAHTALGALQRWMVEDNEVSGEADGTITIAHASSALLAAEVTAQWLRARGSACALLIAQGGNTHLLDEALALAGQPRIGRSAASGHRGSLQLLLLGFKAIWSPFDAEALMELLVLAASPIPPRAARHLAHALEEAPGRGSAAWVTAWETIEAAEVAAAGDDDAAIAKATRRIETWRAWADPQLAHPRQGIPVEQALAICDRTRDWARARYSIAQDPLLHATARLAEEVRDALVALERPFIGRNLVDRIIDETLSIGETNPEAIAEASQWHSVAHPGAVWAPADTLVWWNFSATSEGAGRQPWSAAERHELEHAGVPVADEGRAGRVASAAWDRAILQACERILLISAGPEEASEDAMHPLVHRLAPALDRLTTHIRLEDALSQDSLTLAGSEIHRVPVEVSSVPAPQPQWRTPAGYPTLLAERTQSATAFENLLACPLKWALRHVARVRAGHVRSIPDAKRLIGNLAHALARDIFTPGASPPPDAVAAMAIERLDMFIDRLAAPLRHPALATELSEARSRLPKALAALAQTLQDNGLEVEGTELQISRDFEDALSVRGAIDLVARDRHGEVVIIDLKWTGYAKGRLDELRSGAAVQLATYGAVYADGAPYRAGYFLLNQAQFATLASSGLIGRSVAGVRSLPDIWDGVLRDWRRLTALAADGTLIARGVEGHEDVLGAPLEIEREANCRYCDYARLCRQRGLG
ncbi:PD-(D/E)XK nuclease family protein [Novosphingobium sp. 11B]